MTAKNLGRLRIIAGKWRSRKLVFPSLEYLRPTPDRVRETLFNWLQADVPGSVCLDLFAGSGALGFEAASRGAREVILVEKDRDASAALARNIDILEAGNIQLATDDALRWLQQDNGLYDIVFLDPPYQAGLLSRCCELLESGKNLAENAKIYIEHALGDKGLKLPDNWECVKNKSAGQVSYKLFNRVQSVCQ